MIKSIRISVAFIMLAFNLSVSAQGAEQKDETIKKKKETAKSYIEISGGLSAPVGRFAQANYYDPHSGFAGMGSIFAISGVKYIGHTNWGIGGTLSYASYTLKNLSNIALGYQDSYDVDSTNVHGTKYQSLHALLGPVYSIPLGMVTLDFHAYAGLNAMWSPETDVLLEDGGNSYTYDNEYGITNGGAPGNQYTFWQQSSFAASVAAQFGAGIRVSPVKHFAIAARVDYFYSHPIFDINWVNANPNAFPSVRYFNSYTQPFNGINASLGIDYVFGK